MRKQICEVCSCEFEINQEVKLSKKCPICGTKITILELEPESKKSIEYMRVNNCAGGDNRFLNKTLVIYNDYLTMINPNGIHVLTINYNDIQEIKGGILSTNIIKIRLKNGVVKKILFEQSSMLGKTLPNYIIKLKNNG